MSAPVRSRAEETSSSSDDEYFEIIDGINDKEREKETLPASTNELSPTFEGHVKDESDKGEKTASTDLEKVSSYTDETRDEKEKKINEKDDRINELTEESENKDEEVKKYSALVAPFKNLVERSIDGFDSDFYLAVSDVFLGLIVAIFSSTGIGFLLALGFTMKGVVFCTCAEMSKKKTRETKKWLQADFPETSSSTAPGSVFIDMRELPRTVTLAVGSGRGYGIFDYWGSGSVGFVRSSSIADAQGIRRGDHIVAVDGTALDTLPPAEVAKLYASAVAAGRTSLVVQHNPERLSEIESTLIRFVFVSVVALASLIILQCKLW